MFTEIIKRDGRREAFDRKKIQSAIWKAAQAAFRFHRPDQVELSTYTLIAGVAPVTTPAPNHWSSRTS